MIIGLDLLSFDNILNFYALYARKFQSFLAIIYFMSLDHSSENLSEYCEKKKNYIKSKIQIISTDKTKKIYSTKNQILVLNEITNIDKLAKEIGIFEFNLIGASKNPLETLEFDKLSIYLKEHKNLFESKAKKAMEEPSSTFKLTLNENELQAKNETILPYLKNTSNQNKDNIIQIDQEDLNELYEEDPDGDLDI
jgi:MoaA/NifB/PqqE/SkfB family radical SAM enzyme